jgi:hypothetical protein
MDGILSKTRSRRSRVFAVQAEPKDPEAGTAFDVTVERIDDLLSYELSNLRAVSLAQAALANEDAGSP